MTKQINSVIIDDLETITRNSKDDLEKIVNSHVVLTGASGYIGTWLTLSFLHARDRLSGTGSIVLSCRDSNPIRSIIQQAEFKHGYEFLETDIRNFPAGVINDNSIVIHAATPARESLNVHRPLEMFDIIVEGQKRLLQLSSHKDSVKFVFLSSGAVYGKQPMDLKAIPESWTGGPAITDVKNSYHEAKRVAELLGFISQNKGNLSFVSARLFAFLSPFLPLNEHFAAGNFLKNALDEETIVIKSGGGSIRTYQYSTDLCAWMWAIAVRGKRGLAYNVGSDEEVKISELANRIRTISQSKQPVEIDGFDTNETVTRYVPSLALAKHDLDVDNNVLLDEAISRTLSWARKIKATDK